MELVVLAIVLVVVVIGVFWWIKRSAAAPTVQVPNAPEPSLPYKKEASLLRPGERSFAHTLLDIAEAEGLFVGLKVRLGDLLWVPKDDPRRQAHQNRVQQKHVDFVLCDRATFEPRLVIELDDSSHERAERQPRDAFVDAALGAAGLPILHIKTQSGYVQSELIRVIREKVAEAPEALVAGTVGASDLVGADRSCPKCGSALVIRRARNSGDEFLGCSGFPSCRYTRALNPA